MTKQTASADLRLHASAGRRRKVAALVAQVAVLTACALIGAVGSGAASARVTRQPPPIPDCYRTGSGYGTCEGNVIPGDGTITTLTTAAKNGVFMLHGPSPLQTTKPVACGSIPDGGSCVYNHLNWSIGLGATPVSGCEANTTTCDVRVAPGASTWASVYVRQNNDPALIFLIWNSGKTGYELSGKILADACKAGAKSCSFKPTPAVGIVVTARGAGSGSSTTNNDGAYSMTLPEGSYTVTPHATRAQPMKPSSRSVHLESNTSGVDFTTKATGLTLSGTVSYVSCNHVINGGAYMAQCKLVTSPSGDKVQATGPGGVFTASADPKTGKYAFSNLEKGTYTVAAQLPAHETADPASSSVDLEADTSKIDFTTCREAPGSAKCIVKVQGQVVDIDGAPFKAADVTGDGDTAISATDGSFTLNVFHGSQKIGASRLTGGNQGKSFELKPAGSTPVNAVGDTTGVKVTIQPAITVVRTAVENDPDYAYASVAGYRFEVAGLPLNKTYTVHAEVTLAQGTLGTCNAVGGGSLKHIQTTSLRTYEWTWAWDRMCNNDMYTAKLYAGDASSGQALASYDFQVFK